MFYDSLLKHSFIRNEDPTTYPTSLLKTKVWVHWVYNQEFIIPPRSIPVSRPLNTSNGNNTDSLSTPSSMAPLITTTRPAPPEIPVRRDFTDQINNLNLNINFQGTSSNMSGSLTSSGFSTSMTNSSNSQGVDRKDWVQFD